MPQLSLYVDADTLTKIEKAAKIDHKSISKWVSIRLKNILPNSWPDNYGKLFGSLSDDDLPEIKQLSFKNDGTRLKI